MPLVDASELVIAAVPPRVDARDVLIAGGRTVETLPPGARVGTGSLRRRTQLLAVRPDLQILPLRGNIDTRLRKQDEREYEAVVLAMAGLLRAGLFDSNAMSPIPPAPAHARGGAGRAGPAVPVGRCVGAGGATAVTRRRHGRVRGCRAGGRAGAERRLPFAHWCTRHARWRCHDALGRFRPR